MSNDKELLKEIINNLPYSIRYEGNTEKLIKYAKEQAERVQELERQLKVSNSVHADDRKLLNRRTKQNKRYREELDILGEVINSAPNADKLNEEYERLKGLEGETNE